MITKTPHHELKLSKIYYRSLLLTVVGSVATFAVADLVPTFFIIGFIGACIGYWYASQGPSSISRGAINALLTVVIVLALTNAIRGEFSISSFALFSLLLMILKLFDLRSPRDHGQVLVLSISLIIAAALTSNSLPTGIGVFLMGFVIIRALMLFRLFVLSTSPFQPNEPSRFIGTDLRSIQSVIGFVCVLVALLIFLVMPRSLGSSAFGQWGGASAAGLTTGFADDVQLGRPGRITSSPTPVLRLWITDRNQLPVGSASSKAIYLRGAVLTQYQQGRWVSHTEQSIPTTFRTRVVGQNESVPIVPDNSRADWTREYLITFDRQDQNYGYLFTPWKPLELKSSAGRSRIGVDPDTRMILLATQPVNSYRIRTLNPELEPLDSSQDIPRAPVDFTGISPEIKALAVQILSNAGIDPDPNSRPRGDDFRAVRVLENHLRTQYAYTLLSEPVPQGRDATEWFLFDRRQGHCEYYASALTLMTRSIGLHARVITGFVAAEYNHVTGAYTVRESNAHAWVEAMVAPGVWRTFDGTPQSDFHDIHEPEPTFVRSIAKFYEAIEHAWGAVVVSYDSNDRSKVFGDSNLDLGFQTIAKSLQARIATGRTRLLRKALVVAGIVFSMTMTVGLAAAFILRTPIYRSLLNRLAWVLTFSMKQDLRIQSQTELAATVLDDQIRAYLARMNVPRPKGCPLKTYIESVPEIQNQTIQDAADILYRYYFQADSPCGSDFFTQQAYSLSAELKALR